MPLSDSDDSDDELLKGSVFGGSRASKRKMARDEAAKKKKRMDQMNALLNNGRIKLEQENRMDRVCQQNKHLMKDDDLDDETKTTSTDKGEEGNDDGHTKGSSSASSFYQQYEPKDSRETFCFGSRNTLEFSREIPVQKTQEKSSSAGTNAKESPVFAPFWSGFDEALTDLRTILIAEQQKQQTPLSSMRFNEELLRLCSATSPHACRTYLRKALLSKKKDQAQIRRIHVNILRWFMTLACGPIADTYDRNSIENQETKSGATEKRKRPKTATANESPMVSQKVLMEAQAGAYQTLYRLWSKDMGFPLQKQDQGSIYLLSIRALPRQLGQWFGSSFSVEQTAAESGKNDTAEDNKAEKVQITNSQITLVRFLELWALALQKENENNVHLVQFHHSENRSDFRSDVSNAIMAVLWAGLNPSFASSISAKNDGNKAIQTIVACLLDRVRRDYTSYSNDKSVVSFGRWLEELSEKIVTVWSTKLGRGRKGTDAEKDEHAWLSLARSVTRLVRIDSGRSDDTEKRIVSTLKDFQLSLCRSMLLRAFVAEDGQKEQTAEHKSDEKCASTDGRSNDWFSSLMREETQRMKIPIGVQTSQRWRAMALAVTGLVKLASCFPDDAEHASQCFALMDTCTVCFQSAIVELEPEIRKNLQNDNTTDFDDEDDILASNEMASSSFTDEVLEKHALYNALDRLEIASQIISNKTKPVILRNVCFSWTGTMAETLRNYISSQKEQYAPPSATNRVATKQQSRINSFFQNSTTSLELTTN